MRTQLYLAIIGTTLLFSSCENEWFDVVKGSGPVVSENRNTSSFNDLSLAIPADVYITQGSEEGITIEAQNNILDVIRTDVKHDELEIRFDNGIVAKRYEPIKVFIVTNDLNMIRISGSGNVYNENPLITDELNIRISGSGNVDLHDIDAPVVDAKISGSGKVYLEGYCKDQYLNISGSGDIYAFGLLSETADITISGSGKSEISVSEYLNANISGSGKIYYKGRPDVNSKISGSGSIYHVD
ncbi:MAG TPA: head GIN domain-containing protein [Lentimicrobium sp.]|nr:head GIN domain-containing protein [Lentimicrobium sp.]